jgi:hypothetical protein
MQNNDLQATVDPLQEHRAVLSAWDGRPKTEESAFLARRREADLQREIDSLRQANGVLLAQRQAAEARLAELARMLDAYRDKSRPMPTYAELSALVQG